MTVNHKDMSKKKWITILDPEIPKVKITVVEKEQEEQQVPTCPHCGSPNCYGISRIVGYFSRLDSWQPAKKAEFKKRQKGDYNVK